eukprot:TRINITY_DN13480_c0_g1_i1.p1 TRINITY_DN13480_c0_g1~~TRINITY_DN13480_c0_g1_i1.p1  ORF type:complete len:187 (+),score=72.80 TRINITY_DN13480_c0_g1_i1:179-739(+)
MGAVWMKVRSFFDSERECRVLVLGLDFAGKTTFVQRLKLGTVVETRPTVGFNLETVKYKNITFQIWDMGGQTSLRPTWRCFYDDTDAIIWVLDSVDEDRFGISKRELYSLFEEEELRKSALLVLANKSDLACAKSVQDVIREWDLANINDRAWTVRPCSALTGEGVWEALDWLVNVLDTRGEAVPQ